MKLKKLVTYVITLLILAQIVSAFSITSDKQTISICPTSTEVITSTITGSGSFTVTKSGTAAQWATIVPQGFTSNGQKTVYTYLTPNSLAQPGQYTLQLTFDDKISTQTKTYTINIAQCFKVNVADAIAQSTCPSEKILRYDFIVTNTGEFTETFKLTVKGNAASWTTLGPDSVTLNKGESKTVFAYVNVPQEARGQYEIVVNAVGLVTGNSDEGKAYVNVLACYDYESSLPQEFVEICDRTTQLVPITITNRGTSQNSYSLDLSGPTWAVLKEDSITLNPGETSSVDLVLSPPYDLTKDFALNLAVKDTKGKITKDNPLTVRVKDCHDVLVQVQKDDNMCAALTKTYDVLVKNNGQFEQEFKMSLTGEKWTSLNEQLVKIAPNKEEHLALIIKPPFDAKGSFTITPKATSLDGGIFNSATLNLNVFSQADCYSPKLLPEKTSLEVAYDTTSTVQINIANNGTEKSTFILAVSGTAAGFVQLNPATVTLEPNQAETVTLLISPSQQHKNNAYEATITAKKETTPILDSKTIQIKVVENVATEAVKEKISEKSFWQSFLDFLFGTPKITEQKDFQKTLEEAMGEEELPEELPSDEIEESVKENISIEKPTETKREQEVKEETTQLKTQDFTNFLNKNKNTLLIGLVIILLIVLMARYRKEIIEFFEEEEEDWEEKPKRNGKRKRR